MEKLLITTFLKDETMLNITEFKTLNELKETGADNLISFNRIYSKIEIEQMYGHIVLGKIELLKRNFVKDIKNFMINFYKNTGLVISEEDSNKIYVSIRDYFNLKPSVIYYNNPPQITEVLYEKDFSLKEGEFIRMHTKDFDIKVFCEIVDEVVNGKETVKFNYHIKIDYIYHVRIEDLKNA